MFAVLFHVLSMILPSRLLTVPKISENIEISINSPKTMKMEPDSGTSDVPTRMALGLDESTPNQGTSSFTASSPSNTVDTAKAETEIETPRSLTPLSSGEEGDSPSRKKALGLSELWTDQSEKVR